MPMTRGINRARNPFRINARRANGLTFDIAGGE
jgi:hypothetical protein